MCAHDRNKLSASLSFGSIHVREQEQILGAITEDTYMGLAKPCIGWDYPQQHSMDPASRLSNMNKPREPVLLGMDFLFMRSYVPKRSTDSYKPRWKKTVPTKTTAGRVHASPDIYANNGGGRHTPYNSTARKRFRGRFIH
jgi:hypothetical protein